ncbi:transaldolase [Aeromicrobium duanguangcaii]|uniref:Transaldolase n=1 Tax=Aeromicrobium duanguangcaii TaxID=2968086 RepID=A0ABY5KDY0_9ACTN|nr:transaldolase [Aeromicrobium duanguangcaii]MCL3837280.1 transaldolase [Aeromicrobium duanguangcaii]UUI67312.1 transaldolase [Aeromicrobium duanguangcaii]
MTERLKALSDAGVSIWLDDLSRERIETGNLAELVTSRSVVGVTTNPTIFASALSKGERYEKQVAELKAQGADVDTTVFAITTTDVRDACDILRPVYDRTDGFDGRVSIEVEPGLARDTDGTVEMAERLWKEIDRPNVMIKIPATREGLPAIAAAIAKGISVNVTLIFSLERYRGVMDAYLYGLEQAAAEGRDLSKIHSVASFFISRVDAEVDGRLAEDSPLRGKAALANAYLAYATYQKVFESDRAQALVAQGAHPQRPLWASTGVKDPAYSDTLYVTELVVDGTVNTMPEKTLEAFADHGEVTGDTVTGRGDEAQRLWDELEAQGITYDEVVEGLETEGLKKFDDSWAELLETVRAELDKA